MEQLPVLSSPMLSIIATLTGAFLGLAVAVQVVQELWKYLTSSKSITYAKTLADFLGPWSQRLQSDGATLQLQVRGPLQWFRVRPRGVLLPMTKDQLLSAMDRLQGGWLSRGIEVLKTESRIQQGSAAQPSPQLAAFRSELGKADGETPGYREAQRLKEFFDTWVEKRHPKDDPVDAAVLLEGFYENFVPDRRRVEENYPQFEQNLAYAYQRRNLRQTFFFALLIALVFKFPADRLYSAAKATPEERAFEFLSEVVTLAEEIDPKLTEPEAEDAEPDAPTTAAGTDDAPDAGTAGADDEATAGADPPTATPEAPSTGDDDNGGGEKTSDGDQKRESAKSGLPKIAREDLRHTRRLLGLLERHLSETNKPPKSGKDCKEEQDGTGGPEGTNTEGTNTEGTNTEGTADNEAKKGDESKEDKETGNQNSDDDLSIWQKLYAYLSYLLFCAVTAVFVSFGAPFWHRLSEALVRSRGVIPKTSATDEERN